MPAMKIVIFKMSDPQMTLRNVHKKLRVGRFLVLPDGFNSALTLTREFLGPLPSAKSGKKSKAQKHMKIDAMVCSRFFPGRRAQ